jgi:hypothetical protein
MDLQHILVVTTMSGRRDRNHIEPVDNNNNTNNGAVPLGSRIRRFGLVIVVGLLLLGESIVGTNIYTLLKWLLGIGGGAALIFVIYLIFFSGWPQRALRGPK